jgi:radical SAM superfamily enzyme YgiQ (UPF0313 family)
MPDILLATLNAKYPHASLGLRYLLANLGDLAPRAALLEFEIANRPTDIVERLLREQPRIVGFGVYIWNVRQTTEVVGELRRVAPDVKLVLGGPEVSYGADDLEIVGLADCVVSGEGDLVFADVCRRFLAGEPVERRIAAPVPKLADLRFPYELYSDRDLRERVVYVEASRGCPYECEFCLSSLDIPVRQFPLEVLLAELERLFDRGCRQFKFVDRTFNLNPRVSRAILEFCLARADRGLFAHFEMVPDRFPEALRDLVRRFPPGALQFEIGIQSWNPETGKLISRRQDFLEVEQNLAWLRRETGVHLHTDLIVGLPGEDVSSFGAGFDRLVALGPHEIQVGILKRLRGTPIVRHDAPWDMVYSPHPPYEILRNRLIDFATMQRLKRFARYWDMVANSGRFPRTLATLLAGGSPFERFLAFSDWLFDATGATSGMSLPKLAERLFRFLVDAGGTDALEAARVVSADYVADGHTDRLPFLRPWWSELATATKVGVNDDPTSAASGTRPARQSRHLGSQGESGNAPRGRTSEQS